MRRLASCLLVALAACGPTAHERGRADVDAADGDAQGSAAERPDEPQGASQTGPRPSFVFVSIDTTRADRTSLYGAPRETTPRLRALADDGLLFTQAVTSSENTLISHASLFTGLNPGTHGAHHADGGTPLDTSLTTLAEDFRDAGWATAAFTAHGDWLTPAFGMDQGFETFTHGYRDADVVLDDARAWLAARDRERPFVVLVHVFDVHSDTSGRPYGAPAGFAGRFTADYEGEYHWPDPRWPGGSRFLAAVEEGGVEVGDADLAHLRDQYDEGLAYTDDRVGRFLDEVRTDVAPLFVVVTSDHGEEFLDHGRMMHGSLYDEIVRVPLLIVPPADRAARFGVPRVVDEQVRLVDLRATLLGFAGLVPSTPTQGADLGAWLSGGAGECPSGPAPLYYQALRVDGFKLLRTREGDFLYDLGADPGERVDLAQDPAHARRVAEMRVELHRFRERDRVLREALLVPDDADVAAPLDADAEARLRELGYLR